MAEYEKEPTVGWDVDEVRRAVEAQEEELTPRRRQTPQKRTRGRRKRRGMGAAGPVGCLVWGGAYALFVVAAATLLACAGWMMASDMFAFRNEPTEIKATIEIKAEDDLGSVASKLHDAGLIRYEWLFKLFARFTKADEKIGLGTYTVNSDMDYHALISAMRSSSGNMNADTVNVMIPEGYTVRQIIALLAEKEVSTEEKLLDAAENGDFTYSFIDRDSNSLDRLEGYLFPDTYQFYIGHKPEAALDKLLSNFDRKLTSERLEEIEQSEFSLKQIITIASLIEKETDGTDQRLIASVIYNRLADTGAHGTYGVLNIDAALLYALPDHTGALTNADKEIDSPYNLYRHAGLPPTPIANPGLKAIDAALEPEQSNYYYYALGKDGKHHFSETLEQHNAFLASGDYAGSGT